MTVPQPEPAATLVVCEDDEPTRELLCDHLGAERFDALAAPSASDALRLCHYKQPDLLLLDLNLPDAPGLDVLREIRASDGATGSYDPELAVIVLSGRGTDADRLRGLDCGADDYVVKPFAIQEVVARIRAVLRRRAGRRAGPAAGGRDRRRSLAARGQGRRRGRFSSPTRSSACCGCSPRSRPACSRRRSCCATSGAFARSAARGRSTPTPAGCAASSTPSPGDTWSTAGESDTG